MLLKTNIKKKNFLSLSSKINPVVIGILIIFVMVPLLFSVSYITKLLIDTAATKGNDITLLFAQINTDAVKRMDYSLLGNNAMELLKKALIARSQKIPSQLFMYGALAQIGISWALTTPMSAASIRCKVPSAKLPQ